MKRCPDCRRDYYDDSLLYCLDDGTELLDGPGSGEARTAILPGVEIPGEAATKAQVRTTVEDAAYGPRKSSKVLIVALVVVLIMLGGFFGVRYFRSDTGRINSVAVMLFQNTSGDPNMDYLSDGVAESITNSLSRLGQLKVMATSTMFRYKGREADPLAIGKELGVGAVMTGKVLQQGNRLIVNVELVNVSDGTLLWGEQFNRPVAEILSLQDEITNAVSQKLRLDLSGDDKKRLTKRYTDNPEAYQLYLKGVYHAAKFSKEELEIGYNYLNQAIGVDPNYALAYHGLSYYYYLVVDWTMSPDDAMPKSKRAAQKAIEVDDTLASAHTDLASVYWYYDWNWPAAEKEFGRAIELDPKDALTREQYGWYLVTMGRVDEGLAEAKKSQQLDPLNQEHTSVLGWDLYLAHRYDESLEQQRKAIELDPNYWPGYSWLGHALVQRGHYQEAITSFQKAVAIEPVIAEPLVGLGRAYAVSGRKDEAQKVLAELNDRSKHPYVSSYLMAEFYAGLGDKEKAFASLEKAYTDRSWYLTHLRLDPELEPLRSDPRFADLIRRVGLPD